MTTFGWQHAKVKSTKSNPPGLERWQNLPLWVPCLNICPGTNKAKIKIFLCISDSQWQDNHFEQWKFQKVHIRPELWGFEKMCDEIGQNALTVALFEQPPQGPIRPKSNNLCAHRIANDKTIKGVTKLSKMPWRVPSSNSCHRHKLGWNENNCLPIRWPMTRRSFWALSQKVHP